MLQTVKCDGKKEEEKKVDQSIMRKQSNIKTTHKSLYSAAAFKNSKITSGLTVLKKSCKEGTWYYSQTLMGAAGLAGRPPLTQQRLRHSQVLMGAGLAGRPAGLR